MRPVNGWILVEKIVEEDKKIGSIIVPGGKEKDKLQRCKVLKISSDVHRACKDEKKELPYKEEDVVILHNQVGIEIVPLNKDDNTMFVKFDAVMGVE